MSVPKQWKTGSERRETKHQIKNQKLVFIVLLFLVWGAVLDGFQVKIKINYYLSDTELTWKDETSETTPQYLINTFSKIQGSFIYNKSRNFNS